MGICNREKRGKGADGGAGNKVIRELFKKGKGVRRLEFCCVEDKKKGEKPSG